MSDPHIDLSGLARAFEVPPALGHRLLILGCSAAKSSAVGLLPAADRYAGPHYQVLRRWRRSCPEAALDLAIVSVEYGLLDGGTPLGLYDRRMDHRRAAELAPAVAAGLRPYLDRRPSAVFVSVGRVYAQALPDLASLVSAPLTVAQGGIGQRLGQLRRWLWEAQHAPT